TDLCQHIGALVTDRTFLLSIQGSDRVAPVLLILVHLRERRIRLGVARIQIERLFQALTSAFEVLQLARGLALTAKCPRPLARRKLVPELIEQPRVQLEGP